MRGYVERMEWLEKCTAGPVTHADVMDSIHNDTDRRPERGLCQRCLRAMPITALTNLVCNDRRDCSKALLRLHATKLDSSP